MVGLGQSKSILSSQLGYVSFVSTSGSGVLTIFFVVSSFPVVSNRESASGAWCFISARYMTSKLES